MSWWRCPVCGSRWGSMSLWSKGTPNSTWETHGGGTGICNRCVKTRAEEIKSHNRLYVKDSGAKKDPNCEHDWRHPYLGRWTCVKCQAEYNWMCGHGGSAYVCQEDYDKFVSSVVLSHGSVEAFLKENSW